MLAIVAFSSPLTSFCNRCRSPATLGFDSQVRMLLSRVAPLIISPPNVNESLDTPPHQIRDLPIAHLDDSVDSIGPPRYVYAEERARDTARAIPHDVRYDLIGFSRIWYLVHDEVSVLRPSHELLDPSNAK